MGLILTLSLALMEVCAAHQESLQGVLSLDEFMALTGDDSCGPRKVVELYQDREGDDLMLNKLLLLIQDEEAANQDETACKTHKLYHNRHDQYFLDPNTLIPTVIVRQAQHLPDSTDIQMTHEEVLPAPRIVAIILL